MAARVPIVLPTNLHNHRYMATKVEKLDHVLDDAPMLRRAAQALSA